MGIMEHAKPPQPTHPIHRAHQRNVITIPPRGTPIPARQLTGQLQQLHIATAGQGQQQQQHQQIPSPKTSVNNDQNGNMNGANGHISSSNSDAGSVTGSTGGDGAISPIEERLIVGVDFGTTYSGYAQLCIAISRSFEVVDVHKC